MKKNRDKISLKKILIIDDEASFCRLVKMNLEISGKFSVFICQEGKEGLRMARQILPDVILLDIMMPKTDGFQVLSALKGDAKTAEIPVIMISASSDDTIRVRVGQTGCQYIPKPVNTKDLISKIEALPK